MDNASIKDFKDLQMNADFIFLENISANIFKTLVKEKLKLYAFNQLMMMKKLHTKMKYLRYNQLKMQDYLLDGDTSVDEKRVAFRWRTFMEDFSDNFRGGKITSPCPLCKSHPDKESLSFQCPFIAKSISITGKFDSIFHEHIDMKLIKTICQISDLRKKEVII